MSNNKFGSSFIIVEMVIYAIIQLLFLINYVPLGFR